VSLKKNKKKEVDPFIEEVKTALLAIDPSKVGIVLKEYMDKCREQFRLNQRSLRDLFLEGRLSSMGRLFQRGGGAISLEEMGIPDQLCRIYSMDQI
jgi:hypothetical protein